MASTNHTDNYDLPQWERTDPFCMDDFNDAFEKIDTAIANCGMKGEASSYVGTGAYGSQNKNNLSFEKTPMLVLIQSANGEFLPIFHGVNRAYGILSGVINSVEVNWNGSTVSWYGNNAKNQFNETTRYYYLALE